MNTKIQEYTRFYKKVLAIALPIALQNGVSNFVSLLDNIMIGRVGTEQMTGVAIVNQLMFIFYLCIFGAISGAGIFTAQFYGQGNNEGVRDTFRLKIILSTILLVLAATVFWVFRDPLISLYLHEGSEVGDLAATLEYGKKYLFITLIGLLPYTLECCYSGTLRETGKTVVPMVAATIAVFVNLALNYVLIYGKFGAPELGVEGAALATVISRVLQAVIVIVWTHKHAGSSNTIMNDPTKTQFIIGAYKSFRVMKGLTKKVIILGLPLLINETLWAAGIAAQIQAYSVRGLAVVTALNINSTIANVFNIAFIAMGDAVAIIVGQTLGAGKLEEAKQSAYRIIAFSTFISFICGLMMFFTAPLFPELYNTEPEVKELARSFMRINGLVMIMHGYLHATYFTLRSGGKTIITFLFDSCYLWVIAVPLAYILSNYTDLHITTVFLCCNLLDLIKAVIGFIMVKSGMWVNNIVEDKALADN